MKQILQRVKWRVLLAGVTILILGTVVPRGLSLPSDGQVLGAGALGAILLYSSVIQVLAIIDIARAELGEKEEGES